MIDKYSGSPIPDTLVSFGSMSTTASNNGRFSISLGGNGGIVSGDLSIYKETYTAILLKNAIADSSNNIDVVFALHPNSDLLSYPIVTMSGKIFQSDGATEIPNGTDYRILIASGMSNCSGYENGTYSDGYTIQVPYRSQDCTIAVMQLGSSGIEKIVFSYGNDFSGPSLTVNKDFTFPISETLKTNVSLSSENAENVAMFFTPYGNAQLNGLFKNGTSYSTGLSFTSSLTQQIDLCDQFNNSELFWTQLRYDNSSIVGSIKRLISSSELFHLPDSDSAYTLPAISDDGPADKVNSNSITFSSGTIAIGSVPNANCYIFTIFDNTLSEIYASIASPINTFTIPQWLINVLAGKTSDIEVRVAKYNKYFDVSNWKYTFGVTADYYFGVPGLYGVEVIGGQTRTGFTF